MPSHRTDGADQAAAGLRNWWIAWTTTDPSPTADATTRTLLLAFRLGLITFLCDAPRFATLAGERPQVSALALAELELGRDLVTSLRPSVIRLENPLTRELVRLLDGSRDRPKLLDDLATRMAADTALIPPGEPARPLAWWRGQLAPQIDTGLAQAAQLALLVEQ